MTADEILAAARREGIALVEDRVDTSGLDFVAVHAHDAAGTRWIVRRPRRPEVVEAARHEARVLAAIRDRVPVRVPDWRVHADDVIAYPRIEGTPVVTLDTGEPVWTLDPAAPGDAFVRSLGELLAALQAVDGDLPRDTIGDVRQRLARTIEIGIEELSPPESLRARWRQWVQTEDNWPSHVALAHGDLHVGHLLVEAGRVTGVLDWTEARITDPSTDFAMVHMCFGAGVLDGVIAAFAAAGGRTWPGLRAHAIERAAMFPAIGAEWSRRTGNPIALEQARAKIATMS